MEEKKKLKRKWNEKDILLLYFQFSLVSLYISVYTLVSLPLPYIYHIHQMCTKRKYQKKEIERGRSENPIRSGNNHGLEEREDNSCWSSVLFILSLSLVLYFSVSLFISFPLNLSSLVAVLLNGGGRQWGWRNVSSNGKEEGARSSNNREARRKEKYRARDSPKNSEQSTDRRSSATTQCGRQVKRARQLA